MPSSRIELLQRDPAARAFLAVRCVQRSLPLLLCLATIIKGPRRCSPPSGLSKPTSTLHHKQRQFLEWKRGPRAERGRDGEEAMSSLTQPMPYYPTTSSPITRAQPATASRGSFVPVFTVLGVISFLAVVACVAGRLCGRRLSRKKASYSDQHYYGTDAVGGDLEKGYPPMKPVPSSRAVIHDMDDGFEIKFAPGKPAAWKNDSRGRQQHQHPQAGVGMPREYAGFRYPAAANGVVR